MTSSQACQVSVTTADDTFKEERACLEETGLPSPPQDNTTAFKERWCRNCNTVTTPRWRYGPEGPNTMCNACHLRWKSKEKKNNVAPASPIPEKMERPKKLGRPKKMEKIEKTKTLEKPEKTKTMEKTEKTKTLEKTEKTKKTEKAEKAKKIPEKVIESDENEANQQQLGSGSLHCHSCNKTETPVWRRGPDGLKTLCNACGLQWAKKQNGVIVNKVPTLRDEKEYISHGLYSDERRKKKKNSHSNQFHFPLPIHHGEYIMSTQKDFELPLDFIQQYESGQLKKVDRSSLPFISSTSIAAICPPYKKIRQNIFVERKPNKLADPSVCHCTMEQKCGEDCLNRMLFYECDPKLCPCGDQCTNQRFQKKEHQKKLKVFLTEKRGWGLRTQVDIKKGELVTEYCGEIISHELCEERMRTTYANEKHFYFLDYCKGEVIDACSKGTEARFINHSCEPNCHIEKWAVKGESHLGVFASKDIPAKSELFYDYNFSTFSGTAESHQACHCGSKSCRGTIGKKQRAGH